MVCFGKLGRCIPYGWWNAAVKGWSFADSYEVIQVAGSEQEYAMK